MAGVHWLSLWGSKSRGMQILVGFTSVLRNTVVLCLIYSRLSICTIYVSRISIINAVQAILCTTVHYSTLEYYKLQYVVVFLSSFVILLAYQFKVVRVCMYLIECGWIHQYIFWIFTALRISMWFFNKLSNSENANLSILFTKILSKAYNIIAIILVPLVLPRAYLICPCFIVFCW